MLKHVLLAGAVMIAAPAVAQTAPTTDQDKPATPSTSTTAPKTATPPVTSAPQPADPAAPSATTPAPADPAAAAAAPAPATPADPAAPATAANPAAPAAATPAAPTPGAQIADVVAKEFPSYDKNGDGKLSKAEFGAWMFALRKANDPTLKDDAANKTYVAGAFATADTDKSKSISKDELTNYLTQGQAVASKGS